MRTEQVTKYYCEYCGQQYKDLKTVTRCQERCAKKKEQRQQWFKANPPKYRVGDFVYALPSGGALEVESITKCPQVNCWRYQGTDKTGQKNWFGSQHVQLLLSRQEADSRKHEIRDRLQCYTIEDIFFAAIYNYTNAGVEVDIETRITLRDKDYKWKQ